jgi:hypothetical protein
MRALTRWLPLLAAAMLAACADEVAPRIADLTVESTPPGADCALVRNGVVLARATTPARLEVANSPRDLYVYCKKEGYRLGTLRLPSHTERLSDRSPSYDPSAQIVLEAGGAPGAYDWPLRQPFDPLSIPTTPPLMRTH